MYPSDRNKTKKPAFSRLWSVINSQRLCQWGWIRMCVLWLVCHCYSSAVVHSESLPHCWLSDFDTNSSSRMGERAVSPEQLLQPPMRRIQTNGTCEPDWKAEEDEDSTGTRSHCLHTSGTRLHYSASKCSPFALLALVVFHAPSINPLIILSVNQATLQSVRKWSLDVRRKHPYNFNLW